MQSAVGWVRVCWGERQREDGEKGKCSLALSACSVTNLPMQFVASVVQDQKPVVGRGWWGSHMRGVGPGCQQRRRKNAWAGCGGNQGCSLTALTFGFDPRIWEGIANTLLLHWVHNNTRGWGEEFPFLVPWQWANGGAGVSLMCNTVAAVFQLKSLESLKWVKGLFLWEKGIQLWKHQAYLLPTSLSIRSLCNLSSVLVSVCQPSLITFELFGVLELTLIKQ